MPLTTYVAGDVLTAESLNDNFTFAAGSGGVVQVKSTTKSDAFTMSSTTFADVTGLSVSITPTSATNKILVLVSTSVSNASDTAVFLRLMRDSTPIGIGDTAGDRTRLTSTVFATTFNVQMSVAMSTLDSPNTTSALTYKVQVAGTAAFTVAVNRSAQDNNSAVNGRSISTITVMEVTP